MPAGVNVTQIKCDFTVIFHCWQNHLIRGDESPLIHILNQKIKPLHEKIRILKTITHHLQKRKKITAGENRTSQKVLLLNDFPNCILGGCWCLHFPQSDSCSVLIRISLSLRQGREKQSRKHKSGYCDLKNGTLSPRCFHDEWFKRVTTNTFIRNSDNMHSLHHHLWP